MASRVVQYVVVRRDLVESKGWPTGALIAQCCHACIAAVHLFYTDKFTKDYLSDLDSMHKVVLEVCKYIHLRCKSVETMAYIVTHKQ